MCLKSKTIVYVVSDLYLIEFYICKFHKTQIKFSLIDLINNSCKNNNYGNAASEI